jgi:hypothetical protein
VDRSLTVWSRLAAYGLESCGPFRPVGEPRLARCPCPDSACRHVNTYLNGSHPNHRAWQTRADWPSRRPGGSAQLCLSQDEMRSATMIVGRLVLAEGIIGITDASAT